MLKSISSSAPVARDRRSFTVRGLLSAWHQRGRHPARCSKLAQFGNEVVQVSGTQPNQELTGLREFGRIGCVARNLQTERELSFGVNSIKGASNISVANQIRLTKLERSSVGATGRESIKNGRQIGRVCVPGVKTRLASEMLTARDDDDFKQIVI